MVVFQQIVICSFVGREIMFHKRFMISLLFLVPFLLVLTCCKKKAKSEKPIKIQQRSVGKGKRSSSRDITSFFDEDLGEFFLDDDTRDLRKDVKKSDTIILNDGEGPSFDLTGENALGQPEDDELFWEDRPEDGEDFEPIYYNFDKHDIRADQRETHKRNIERAKKVSKKRKKIVVEGHACSSAGSETYNLLKSQDRTKTVGRDLGDEGVEYTAVGRGTSMPKVSGDRDQQAPNRRTEMFAIST